MILRLHSVLTGCLTLLLAALLAFAPVGARPASVGYQLIGGAAAGHQADRIHRRAIGPEERCPSPENDDPTNAIAFIWRDSGWFARDESDRSFSYNSMSGTAFETDFTAFGAGTCGGVYDAACMSRFQAASIRSDLIHSAVFAVEAATPWGTIVDGYECASQPRVSACLAAAISLVPTGTILRAGGKLFIKTGPEFVPATQELVEVATSTAKNTRTVATNTRPRLTIRDQYGHHNEMRADIINQLEGQ